MKRFALLVSLLSTVVLAGCSAADEPGEDEEAIGEQSSAVQGGINAKGAFTCDFRVAGDAFTPQQLAPALERDRMIMSNEANGMLHKHLPLALDFTHFSNGQPDLWSGGRYLFKKAHQASDYRHFVEEEFVLDGVQFLERSYFFDPECHDYKVAGARDFTDVETTQVIMRTERFHLSGNHAIKKVKNAWPAIEAEAEASGMAAVWLIYNEDEDLASVVYYHDRIVPYDPNVPDFASLGYLESQPPLGHHLEDLGFARTFDRTEWVLQIWLPFVDGDHGDPAVWPHSPPFALPFCGDGVCEVSRGENAASCASDCPLKCGNAKCNSSSENDLNCPGDCGGTCN